MIKKIVMTVVFVFLLACIGFLAQERYRLSQLVVISEQTIADLKNSVDKLNETIAGFTKQLEEKQAEIEKMNVLFQQKENDIKRLEGERQAAVAEKEKISNELAQSKESAQSKEEMKKPQEKPVTPEPAATPSLEAETMPEGGQNQVQASVEEQAKLEI